MNKQDFSSIEEGCIIWTIHLDKCVVRKVSDDRFWCSNELYGRWYFKDGKENPADKFPSAFWSNPNIQIPERPKRKVKKEMKIWIHLNEDGTERFFSTSDMSDIFENPKTKKIITGLLTYEVEE